MAAEGLGYFDKKGRFVETPPSSTSELDSAKAMRDQAKDNLPEITKVYAAEIKKTQDQIDGLKAVTTSKTAYDSAAASAADAQRALTAARAAEETAKTAVEGLATKRVRLLMRIWKTILPKARSSHTSRPSRIQWWRDLQ